MSATIARIFSRFFEFSIVISCWVLRKCPFCGTYNFKVLLFAAEYRFHKKNTSNCRAESPLSDALTLSWLAHTHGQRSSEKHYDPILVLEFPVSIWSRENVTLNPHLSNWVNDISVLHQVILVKRESNLCLDLVGPTLNFATKPSLETNLVYPVQKNFHFFFCFDFW